MNFFKLYKVDMIIKYYDQIFTELDLKMFLRNYNFILIIHNFI